MYSLVFDIFTDVHYIFTDHGTGGIWIISIVDKNVVESELNYNFLVQFLMYYNFLGSIFDILQNLFTKWR